MIHMKLDWFSCVIHHASIKEVAEILGLDFPKILIECENEIANKKRLDWFNEQTRGCLVFKCFDYNNIFFRLRRDDWKFFERAGFMSHKIDIFNEICDEICLEISGTGLDYLRSLHDTADEMLMTESLFGYLPCDDDDEPQLRAHCTRADIAFDFVNVHKADFDQMYRELAELQLAGAVYIPCVGSNAASHFSLKIGGKERTIYLGTTRANRLLRIYDKKLERVQKDKKTDFDTLYFTEVEKKNDPNFELDSWFRVEYQTRSDIATACLYGCGLDLSRVMREICNRYCLAYPNLEGYHKGDHMKPIECFHNVFEYEGLTRIGLNNHFCRAYLPDANTQIDNWFEKNFVSLCMFFIKYKIHPPKLINELLCKYHSDNASEREKGKYRSFKRKIASYMMCNGLCTVEETEMIYLDENACYQFRQDKILSEQESSDLLEYWDRVARANELQRFKNALKWYQDLFDMYCMRVGGLSNDKLMQEILSDLVALNKGYDPRLDLAGGDL